MSTPFNSRSLHYKKKKKKKPISYLPPHLLTNYLAIYHLSPHLLVSVHLSSARPQLFHWKARSMASAPPIADRAGGAAREGWGGGLIIL